MEQGKNVITIELERGMIKDFEKRVLAEGKCSAFLPVSFVSTGDREKLRYDCSGYRQVAGIQIKGSVEIVSLLEKIVSTLIDSCGYLINPAKMELNPDTVFYSGTGKKIKFAYVPAKSRAKSTIGVLKRLLETMNKDVIADDTQGCMNAVVSYIEHSNDSLFDTVNYIRELKRELYACGWDLRST